MSADRVDNNSGNLGRTILDSWDASETNLTAIAKYFALWTAFCPSTVSITILETLDVQFWTRGTFLRENYLQLPSILSVGLFFVRRPCR